MKTKFLFSFLFIFFLVIFFIFYKGLNNSNIYTPNINVKKKIPNFNVKVFDNDTIISSEEIFKDNKFYILNIWASWCVPCRDEHSFLLDLKKENIEIIGLNYKDSTKNAKFFLEELTSPYSLILTDKDGTIAIEWGAYGVPETFVVKDKKIIKKIIGPLNTNSFTEIKRIIK
tara:strand:+ start:85 stop:600 length:516 start_codon:yes stop_codon:yes gene_type:complete